MLKRFFNLLFVWLINNCLKLLKLKVRNKNLWIFGSWGGDNYSDNSKYFYEYVIEHLPHIDAIWITNNESIKQKLNYSKKKCYLYNEFNGRKARLNAGFVFFTNGMNDFGKYDLCHGAVVVALWHGMPLKKMQFASNNLKQRKKNFLKLIQYFILKIYNQTKRDITIATSETTKKNLIDCFESKPSTVLITGQPRNDVLFDNEKAKILKLKLCHPLKNSFILYMPTWRNFNKQDLFLEDIIKQLINDNSFINKMKINNVTLYVKPHPRTSIYISDNNNNNIVVVDEKSNIDTQELLSAADVLITDYSSVFIDYALLNRPTHFFVPDLNEYEKSNNGLLHAFNSFSDFWFNEIEILKAVILNNSKFSAKGINNSIKINSIYNDLGLKKGQYCSRLIDELNLYFK